MRRIVVAVLAAGALALAGVGIAQAHDFRGPHHHPGHHFQWFPHPFGFHHHPGFGHPFHPGHQPGHFEGRHH